MRPTRDETGLALAHVWAQRATCARRKVGCVLFDADGYQLSAGYNGPAAGEPHCVDHPCPGAGLPSGTGLDECEALHAEWNAVARCADVRLIHTCYVTSSPCVACAKILLGTGCRRVVFAEAYPQPRAELIWRNAGREWVQLPTFEGSWQPMVTAPKDGTHVLVSFNGLVGSAYWGRTRYNDQRWCGAPGGDLYYDERELVGWKPAPEPVPA